MNYYLFLSTRESHNWRGWNYKNYNKHISGLHWQAHCDVCFYQINLLTGYWTTENEINYDAKQIQYTISRMKHYIRKQCISKT